MSERDTYGAEGAISIHRNMDGKTRLVEVWMLSSMNWSDGDIIDDPIVDLYICDTGDAFNVPPAGDTVHDTMGFSDAPEAVQDELIQELFHMMELRERLFKHAESDSWPEA